MAEEESFESFEAVNVPKESAGGAGSKKLEPKALENDSFVLENDSSVMVEFEKAGRRISRAQEQLHEA